MLLNCNQNVITTVEEQKVRVFPWSKYSASFPFIVFPNWRVIDLRLDVNFNRRILETLI